MDKRVFVVECAAFAGEGETFLAGDLGDGASGSEVALEDSNRGSYTLVKHSTFRQGDSPDMTRLLDRVADRSNDILTFPILLVLDLPPVDVFTERLAGHGHGVARHQSFLDQERHDTYEASSMPIKGRREKETYLGYHRSC